MSDGFATEQNIRTNVIFVRKALDFVPDPEIKLLPKILPFPHCGPQVPHALVS